VTSNKPVRRRKKSSTKNKKAENKKAEEITPVTVPAKGDAPVVQKTADVEKREEEKNEE
jgi:hypothetical protein